jgi:hypothetical protein
MNFYFSGSPMTDAWTEQEARMVTHRLFSLHGDYSRAVKRWLGKVGIYEKYPKFIMLDSGAFTAWNKGYHTTVEEVIRSYDDFLESAEAGGLKFDEVWMISLDVIPGERGRTATEDEMKRAMDESDINTERLIKHFGKRILPVFHQNEPESRLHAVMEQAEYICLSPRNDMHENPRTEWASWAHTLCPNNRTHGLATTGIKMTYDVPWYSVDSASWVHLGAYGKIIIDLGDRYTAVPVSLDSSSIDERGGHYETLTPHEQEVVRDQIAEAGFTLAEVQNRFRPRALVNIHSMLKHAERAKNVTERKPAQGVLFA